MSRKSGFTLIELLIVVAIIAILAAIAVPNFLEAQVRSKIARCKADMRSLVLAAEAYKIDTNKYMPDNVPVNGKTAPDMQSWTYLSTPIAYITSVVQSPFREYKNKDASNPPYTADDGNRGFYFEYWSGSFKTPTGGVYGFYPDDNSAATGIWWRGSSVGPDNLSDYHNIDTTGNAFNPQVIKQRPASFVNTIYDPTNGTTSRGDFFISNQGFHQ